MAKKPKKTTVEFTDEQCAKLENDCIALAQEPARDISLGKKPSKIGAIIEKQFDIIHEALTVKNRTKKELIQRWNDLGIPLTLFVLNRYYNAIKKTRGIVDAPKVPSATEPVIKASISSPQKSNIDRSVIDGGKIRPINTGKGTLKIDDDKEV
jgi:hypothetical protein